ncbi:MAG: hypothetical protein ACE5NM_02070 [Sedimentisphaerales bacterium]
MGDSGKNYTFCILSSVFCLLSFGLYGCSVWRYLQPDELSYEKLSLSYRWIRLNSSSSHDVLRMIHSPQFGLGPNFTGTRLLSQSDTVIASVGRSYDGYKSWFTMVSFDERDMTANRKYFYLMDERALLKPTGLRHFQILPKPGLIFDCQMVLQLEVLAKPYATEQARQITILKHIAKNLSKDIDELGPDNQTLAVSGMLMNQVFEAALLELDKSPVRAKNLSEKSGVQFNHISLGKGRISMTVEDNIGTVRIRLGIFCDW